MTTVTGSRPAPSEPSPTRASDLPAGLGPVVEARTFEAIVFDWDGTAVPDRSADASDVRARVEALCAAGVHVFVVSGTNVGNVDGQLRARPAGPGRLYLCLNRGSEVFEVGRDGPELTSHRAATGDEDAALDRAAQSLVERLGARGLRTQIVSARMNRRKIDLIPEPMWADPPKARIGALIAAVTGRLRVTGLGSLADVIALASNAARQAGLDQPCITSDGKYVEIGLTDKSHSARWIAAWLEERGITGGLVLIGGDEFGPLGDMAGSDSYLLVPEMARAPVVSVGVEPNGVPAGVVHAGGGPACFLAILDAQLARRRDRRVPGIDDDPGWVVTVPGEREMERAAEAIATLGNGRVGLRGAREEGGPSTSPLFVVGGVYTSEAVPELLPGPVWTGLTVRAPDSDERRLDLRTGVLLRVGGEGSRLRTFRFVSAARPDAMALRAEGAEAEFEAGEPFVAPASGMERLERAPVRLARTGDGDGARITVAARDSEAVVDGTRTVERLATWVAHRSDRDGWDRAAAGLARLEEVGFDGLLAEHRAEWARRWADAGVTLAGDADAELAARFAIFHLLASVPDEGEAAVGARGLSGAAYGGHVFWDADVFALPVLAAIRPAAARAMLEYRIRRLPAARAAATANGYQGARFPWESATDGTDVTPRFAFGTRGELIAIRTGDEEEHIVAEVAWAACEYAAWTGDAEFLAGPARDLILDAARYWASRIRVDADGRGHLDDLMGPDEYHEIVDDNAFTNVMARWNLRRAARLVHETGGDAAEADRWRGLAAALVDGWDPERGIYEQFAGYRDLEPLLVTDVAPPPFAADLLLGTDRVASSQLIKQADVVMLHHLVHEEVFPDSLPANLAYYEPRTAHGSSLSPAIHAALYARAGQPERALEFYRMAARLDLDDVTGTTASGLHLATMGGVWQALAYGFLGLRVRDGYLGVEPCLPRSWEELGLRFRLHGHPVGVRATHDTVTISCTTPLSVRIGGEALQRLTPPGGSFHFERSDP